MAQKPSRYRPPAGVMVVDMSDLSDDATVSASDLADTNEPATPQAARKPVSAEDFIAAKPQSDGILRNLVRAVLPSTTLSDYIEGPAYAAANPIDSIGLILSALKDAHAGQAQKAGAAARDVINEPTFSGKAAAASRTLGHTAATLLPVLGPAAASVGEQGASGDVRGMIGGTTGLVGGVFAPKVAKATTRVVAPVKAAASARLEGAAVTQMQKALNPTRIDTKVKAARVAPEMLKRRIWNKDLETLEGRAANEADTAGQAVDRELSLSSQQTADVQPLIAELERAKEPYIGTTTTGGQVVNEPARIKAVQKLQDTLTEYGDKVSVESMVKLRRGWDEIVNAARGFVQPDLKTNIKAWAAREGRSTLRDALARTVPDINEINAEYAFWQNIEDVAHATNERRVGQARNLTSTIAGVAGAAAAEAAVPGSGVVLGTAKGVAGFKLAGALKKLVESPGYQMWSAVQKQRLADALMSRNPRTAEVAISNGLRAVAVRPRPSTAPSPSEAFARDQRKEDERRAGGG